MPSPAIRAAMTVAATAFAVTSFASPTRASNAAPEPSTGTPAVAGACSPAATFSFAPRRGVYLGAAYRTQVVSGTANCAATVGMPAFVTRIRSKANAQLQQWKTDWAWYYNQGMTKPPGSYDRGNAVVVNVPGLVVVKGAAYLYYGGAHGVDAYTYDILNTRSGRIVTKSAMLAEMQRAGGPYWNFERELNHWAPSGSFGQIERDHVSLYPTRTGMHVAVDMCTAYACAAGTVEYEIPWASLIAPDANMSFIPNQWGH